MAIIKAISSKASLKRGIDYITNPEKTKPELTAAIGCSSDPKQALIEMETVKAAWGKTEGRQYKHLTMSYPAEEKIAPERALQNAMKLFGETEQFKGHQMLLAVHQDTDHLHVHVIVNSVNVEDGHKVQFSKANLADLKSRCNELHHEQGLSIPEKGNEITTYNKNKYAVMEKALSGEYKSYLIDCYKAASAARDEATSREDFIDRMKAAGWETTWTESRKHITFADHEGNKVRAANLEKTFKETFTKEELTRGFEVNAERAAILDRATEQSRGFEADRKSDLTVGGGQSRDIEATLRKIDDAIESGRAASESISVTLAEQGTEFEDERSRRHDRGATAPDRGTDERDRGIPGREWEDQLREINAGIAAGRAAADNVGTAIDNSRADIEADNRAIRDRRADEARRQRELDKRREREAKERERNSPTHER